MVDNWWYKLKGGDSTRKKKSKIWNKTFSFEALFLKKSILNFCSVRVHFITFRYNGLRATERKDYCSLSYFKTIEYVRKCS